MADIAEIGFKADTSGLEQAKTSLDALSPSAAKVEKASEKLEKAMGDASKASDKLAGALEKGATSAATAANANGKVVSSMDEIASAAKKAETASASLNKQLGKAATPVNLNDQAKSFLATQKPYDSGLQSKTAPRYSSDDLAKGRAEYAKFMASIDKTSAANDNLKKSLDETPATINRTTSAGNTLVSALARMAAGFLAVVSINKLGDWLVQANSATIALGETAKRTGIDIQRLQALQFAGVSTGMDRKEVSTGLEGLAEKLNESRQTETTLSKLFDENNIKLKTRTGEVISTNDALLKASGLIQNAATEFDKIKIAEALGLTRDWIPLLEQGPDALNRIANAAEGAGGVIDSGMVQRAKDFQRDWAVAIDRWVTMFQAAAGPIIAMIDAIIAKAQGLFGALDRYSKGLQIKADIEANGANVSSESMKEITSRFAAEGKELPDALKARLNELNEYDREKNRASSGTGPLTVTVNKTAGGGATKTKSLFPDKGGGGGSGKTDEENFDSIVTKAEVRIEKLKAERDAIGLTADAAARLKYETDLLGQAKKADIDLTDAQKEKLIGLAGQMAATETETKNLKSALDFGKDVTKGFLTDFVNGIKNGESAFESLGKAALNVLNKIGDKLISMAVDSLFTTGGSGAGGIGGFFSSVMKLFTGGSALGDAFTGSGKVSSFANGGTFTNSIVSRPTPFTFANGAAFGEMGEAGPEAIMPLQRGSDGSLGVQMYGKPETSAPVNNTVDVTNVYQISGAVSSEEITAQIRATAEQTLNTTKKSLSGWLGQIGADGAVV